jgi:glyoxylase-like metal-dependent hydrolase (beta-lactamase superfamily II)
MRVQRIPVRETNCYLLHSDEGVVLIDPGPPGGAAKAIAGAEAEGIRPTDIRLIYITHGHLDHYGAAAQVKAWCGAPVATYHTEPEFTRDRRNAVPPGQILQGSLVRWFYLLLSPLVHVPALEADLLLDEGADLSAYGVEAHTILLPGHAPGSLGLITAEGDAFVGDLFVNYIAPARPIYESDRKAWQRSYERLKGMQPRRVYVGHGDPFPGQALAHIYAARYQFRWWVR